MTEIAGRRVLITGAASGIGRLLALRLPAAGAEVVAWDIDEAALARLMLELGSPHRGYCCDVTVRDEVYSGAARVRAEAGHIDILVNNAGVVSGKRFLE